MPSAAEEPPRRKKSRFAPPPTGAVDLQAGEGRGEGIGVCGGESEFCLCFGQRPVFVCVIRCVSEGLSRDKTNVQCQTYPTHR